MDILDPKEEVEEEGILATLFGMTYEQIETLQEQTHPSRLATFKSKASQLNMVRSQLTQLSVTVHQLRQMDQTPGVRDKINSIAKIVIRKRFVTKQSKSISIDDRKLQNSKLNINCFLRG